MPENLPQDFLRIMLNQQQLDETNDTVLAHRLQYGTESVASRVSGIPAQFGGAVPTASYVASLGRGRLQIDVVEARLLKNYSFLKMDPYVRLKIGDKIYETPTDYSGGKTPNWRKTLMW